ncbi:decaprenyl-phosphate phosphoribosyltransferase [Nocardioides massiliensis]|uniref:Decaprenyl-phosphate phosphoribosyltransferase n=1 Tax=Nocardioides massiliensis TaxID=1325935 RepID=A0ABT9NUE4_9ACTN|nr:decaprenyl-phosphate phosphoribosyltransferase [Nocardioides massiliensis]
MTVLASLLRTARPKQWTKNLLVVAAPLAAGSLWEPAVLGPTILAFVAFCLLSSAVYAVNDVADRVADRAHPTKRMRPIASGTLSVRAALVGALALAAVGLGLAALASWSLAVLLAAYVVLMLAYAFRLKHEPVIDISIVTAGFLMRAVAGGLAADLRISQWFLLVAGFGALFIVSGKRYSELHTLGNEVGTRRALIRYTATYLRFVWGVAAGATVMSYSLWAFEVAPAEGIPWHTISIAPFVVGVLRYAVDIDDGTAAEPEDIVLEDRVLQGLGVLWIGALVLGVLDV